MFCFIQTRLALRANCSRSRPLGASRQEVQAEEGFQMSTNPARLLQLSALAIAAFAAAMTVKAPEANAIVYCVEGVYRAGCVARPVAAPPVHGVARRTARRVGRRSDMMLKHDILLLGRLDNGLGFYRFRYNG